MTVTVAMRAPTAYLSGLVQTAGFVPSGANYTPSSTGVVQAALQDIPALVALGFTTVGVGTTNGLLPSQQRYTEMRNNDGSVLATSAAAGKFGQASTVGTSLGLVGEAATGNTKTDDAILEYVLPQSYVAGQNLTVTVNASISGSGTNNASSIGVKAYKMSTTDTAGSNIGPGVTQATVAAGADLAFTITGTTLNPGDKIVMQLEAITIESGGSSSITTNINSLRLS